MAIQWCGDHPATPAAFAYRTINPLDLHSEDGPVRTGGLTRVRPSIAGVFAAASRLEAAGNR